VGGGVPEKKKGFLYSTGRGSAVGLLAFHGSKRDDSLLEKRKGIACRKGNMLCRKEGPALVD